MGILTSVHDVPWHHVQGWSPNSLTSWCLDKMGVFTIGLGHSHHTSSKKPSEVVGNGKYPNLGCPIPGRDFLPKVPNGSLGLAKYMYQSLDLDVGMLEVINGCFWDLLYFAQDGSLLALGGVQNPLGTEMANRCHQQCGEATGVCCPGFCELMAAAR